MGTLVPVALFTSTEKTQSKSKFRLFAMVCLLFSVNEHIAVGISSRTAFCLFVVAQVGTVFSQFCDGRNSFARVYQLQSEQIFHYIHICEVIPAQFIFKKTSFRPFLSCIFFLFSFSRL